MTHPTRRLLLLSNQPPGGSGVQAIRYGKLLPHLRALGWELHVIGPDPALDSVFPVPVEAVAGSLHYVRSVGWSRRWSIRRHRLPEGHPLRGVYSVLQAASLMLERLRRAQPEVVLQQTIGRGAEALLRQYSYDAVAGDSPHFGVLEQAARCAVSTSTPLLAFYADPHGRRTLEGFSPADPLQQQAVLEAAVYAVFASPLTRQRYIEAGLVRTERSTWISDSYPVPSPGFQSAPAVSSSGSPQPFRLLHLGNLDLWRPVEPLMEALQALAADASITPVVMDQFGYIYPEARHLVAATPVLRSRMRLNAACPYAESHRQASGAAALLVVAGPRHLDNVPSKFFEYLGHRKPILVLAPRGSCMEDIIERYPVGLVADVTSAEAIEASLRQLVSHSAAFESAYASCGILEAHAAPVVASRLVNTLERALQD